MGVNAFHSMPADHALDDVREDIARVHPREVQHQDAVALMSPEESDWEQFKEDQKPGNMKRKGRRPGQHNRTTEYFIKLVEMYKEKGYKDPIEILMSIASGIEIDEHGFVKERQGKSAPDYKSRVMAASELCSYMYAKRKAVEVTGAEGAPLTFSIVHDNTPIPVMPTADELALMRHTPRTIEGNPNDMLE